MLHISQLVVGNVIPHIVFLWKEPTFLKIQLFPFHVVVVGEIVQGYNKIAGFIRGYQRGEFITHVNERGKHCHKRSIVNTAEVI